MLGEAPPLEVVALPKVLLFWDLRGRLLVLVHPDHVGEASAQKVIQHEQRNFDSALETAFFGWGVYA